MKPTCLIIDDEPIAARGLAEDLNALALFAVTGIAHNTAQAHELYRMAPVDLLFLDIEMPGRNGLEFLKSLPAKPLVILVTAYQQYALKGYEHGVVDYLLKPVSPERLRIACEKALEWHALRHPDGHLYVKCDGKYQRIDCSEITHIEAANNYILIHMVARKYMVYQSLKTIRKELSARGFVQVHKSFVVATRHITQVDGSTLLLQDIRIPLSRRYRTAFLQELQLTRNILPVA